MANRKAPRKPKTVPDANTRRKRAEEALRQSEERFRALVEFAPVAIVIIDGDGRIVLVNARTEELFGYRRDELVGQPMEILLPERFRDAHITQRAEYFSDPQARPMGTGLDFVGQRKDGTEFPIDCGLGLVKLERGVLAMAFATDITERMRAEKTLRESEERYRDLYEEAPIAYFSVGVDGRVRAANRAAAELLGYALDDLLGRPVFDLYADTPEGKAKAAKVVQRFGAGQEIRGDELTMQRADGTHVWISLSVRPIRDPEGKVVASRSMAVDITERKRAEEEVRKFKTMSDNANCGAAMTDLAGNLTYVNDYFAGVHGYKPTELIGKNLSVFHNEEQLEEVMKINQGLQERGSYSALEVWHAHKDGSVFPMLMNGMILRDKDGQPLFMAATAIDITERKQAEEALRKRTHDLGERVKELNCLYGISHLVEQPAMSLEEILQRVADLIPPGWQYPEITCGRVILDGQEFRTDNFRETIWKQTSDVIVSGKRAGAVEVYYLEEKPVIEEGPFLKEERLLITAIAERLEEITERKRADEALQQAREELEGKVERQMLRRNPYGLTFREFTVLHLVAAGRADKEIASELGISPLTASKHVANILAKMDAASRTEAGVRAVREGLLD